jgi:hypothetical protein
MPNITDSGCNPPSFTSFYDSLIPFDSSSIRKIKQAGYPDPLLDFLAMNWKVFDDLRKPSECYRLGVPDIRRLDAPWTVDRRLPEPVGGQPLSRVVDKIFYKP